MDDKLNSFLDSTPFLYPNEKLPINSYEDLENFKNHVDATDFNNKENLTNLIDGLNFLLNKNVSTENLPYYFKGPSALYYFKVYSSLMTPNFFNKMLDSSDTNNYNLVLNKLYDNASQHDSEIKTNYEKYIQNWNYNASYLETHYGEMKKHNNNELASMIDDNTTLLRQASLNNDLYLRRQFLNKRLSSTFYFICVLILIGFLKSVNFNPVVISSMVLFLIILYIINIVSSYRYQNNMHNLNFNKLKHPGYPIKNEETQQKYLGNCGTSTSDYSSNKCKF